MTDDLCANPPRQSTERRIDVPTREIVIQQRDTARCQFEYLTETRIRRAFDNIRLAREKQRPHGGDALGTFGGRAKQATIKIYRSNNASSPACILNQFGQMTEFAGLITECGDDRARRDKVMAEFAEFGG